MEKLNTRMTRTELQDKADGLENQLNLTQENSRLKDQVASAQPATVPVERTKKNRRRAGNDLAILAAGLGLVAVGIGGGLLVGAVRNEQPATPGTSAAAGQSPDATTLTLPDGSTWISGLFGKIAATQSAAASAKSEASANPNETFGEQIAVPQLISGDMVKGLVSTTIKHGPNNQPFTYGQYQEGTWFLPLFDQGQVSWDYTDQSGHHDANWRGIGPWYPEAFRNIDAGAAHLTSHGAVGETVVVADKGGMVEFDVMQLGKHQKDGATDGEGNLDPNSAMQYTGKGFEPYQTIWVVDPDTGKQLFWPDGSPVIYKASKFGDASFAIPATDANHDVRVGFAWNMGPSKPGEQPHEIKWERGPYKTDANGKPVKTGENPLPDSVVKPAVKS